jgi:hypothetical protein
MIKHDVLFAEKVVQDVNSKIRVFLELGVKLKHLPIQAEIKFGYGYSVKIVIHKEVPLELICACAGEIEVLLDVNCHLSTSEYSKSFGYYFIYKGVYVEFASSEPAGCKWVETGTEIEEPTVTKKGKYVCK